VRFIRPSSVSRLRCLMESAIPGPWFEPGLDAAASHQRPHRRRTVAKRERCTVRQVNLTLWLAFRRRAPAARHHADHPLDVLRLPAWSRQADDVPDLATKSGSVESSSVHVEGWGSARPGRLGAAGSVFASFLEIHAFSDNPARNRLSADPGISCRLRRSRTRDVHDSTLNADVGSAVSSAPLPLGKKLEGQRQCSAARTESRRKKSEINDEERL
jgi:hypothetical protein